MKEVIVGLSIITSAGIFIYWILVLTKTVKVNEIVPGYRQWFMAFPIADTWIAFCSLLTAIYLFQNNEKAFFFGLLTASGLIFLGLYALTYGIITGILFKRTIGTSVEIIIKLYCLLVGLFFLMYFW